jgi:adenylate cyclase
MSSTRRLAAILAADVAGYSRLMGADEEGTLERLKALRRELFDPKIAEHHGRIPGSSPRTKTTGDGLLVEFPSVVDAVRCAIVVQQAMREGNTGVAADNRIELRIGINLGDVIVEGDDIYGDGVNIAARIEALADAGGVFVSNTVHDQVRDRLPFVFEDLGEQQVKNIARPVRVYRVRPEGPLPSPPLPGLDPGITGEGSAGGARVGAAEPPALSLPDKPSIAVLPFANMSGDPEQEYFADGMVEEIITALSRIRWFFVIARNSSFTYKGRAVDVKQVGHELGVRYVLEGSVRKAGNRIRVTAQLVEAESGNHVWAERYDRDLADIFAVQDEITEAVTIAIAPAIAEAERQHALRKQPENLNAWTAYQRGLWHLRQASAKDNEVAQRFLREALKADVNFAAGYCGLAIALFEAGSNYQTRDLQDALVLAEKAARHAVAIDSTNAEAHACLARALSTQGDQVGARAEVERALELNPNSADAYSVLGAILTFSGSPKEGTAALEKSIRLDPHDPRSATRLYQIAMGLYYSGEYEAAVNAALRVIRAFPTHPPPPRLLAAALGQLGRTEEAKQALRKAIELAPGAFAPGRKRMPWVRPEDHAHMLEGLRKAGWKE